MPSKDKEAINARARKYKANNKDKVKAYQAEYRKRKKAEKLGITIEELMALAPKQSNFVPKPTKTAKITFLPKDVVVAAPKSTEADMIKAFLSKNKPKVITAESVDGKLTYLIDGKTEDSILEFRRNIAKILAKLHKEMLAKEICKLFRLPNNELKIRGAELPEYRVCVQVLANIWALFCPTYSGGDWNTNRYLSQYNNDISYFDRIGV